jgi:peptide/nickel transport system permease protein
MSARTRSVKHRVGFAVLGVIATLSALGPLASPNDPDSQFADRAYAPPTRVHLWDATGLHLPFIYQQRLHDRLLREYRDDEGQRQPIEWFTRGRLWSVQEGQGPLLLLGADSLGRDIFARLVHGARLSLGVALIGVAGALLLGALIGGLAGCLGGRADTWLMSVTDLFFVLPGAYLVLALRGVLPLRLSSSTIFWLMGGLFAVSAWPHVARGVRAIVSTERACDYAEATRAAGAGPLRQLRNLLPAAHGFLAVQTILLLPALIVAEATISVLGLGFPAPTASWGSMLQEAANVSALAGAPWMLSPAIAMFLVALSVHLVTDSAVVESPAGRR